MTLSRHIVGSVSVASICRVINTRFIIFGENSKIQNDPSFLGRGKSFENWLSRLLRYPVGQNFDKIALSRMVKEIEANLCFCIFRKNSKWPPFLGRGNFFF